MLSRPNFEVDIVKSNGKTLSFTCNYLHPEELQQDGEGNEKRRKDIKYRVSKKNYTLFRVDDYRQDIKPIPELW